MALAVRQLSITFSAVGQSGGNISTTNRVHGENQNDKAVLQNNFHQKGFTYLLKPLLWAGSRVIQLQSMF